jgi:putative transposase
VDTNRQHAHTDQAQQMVRYDMTKVLVAGFGWVYIVVVLAWYTKKSVGYSADMRCTTPNWLTTLDRAVNQQFPDGVRGHALSLMCDNGCQPTAMAFMEACRTLGLHRAFTNCNNPQGNAATERFIRTLTEECVWLQEWTCPFASVSALQGWIDDYNAHDSHSTLGYQTPRQFEQDYHLSHGPPFVAA